MPYFPVDDDMAFHPKILAAGNEALGMWTRAGALSKKHHTGGFVASETVRALGGKKIAARLVAAGLWVVVDGGYHFHDWKQQAGNDDAHVEKARAEKARERNAKRQAEWRARHAASNGVTNGADNPHVTGTPSPSPNDFFQDLQSQSSSNRARVSTDAIPISPHTRRMANDQGIRNLRTVVDAVHHDLGLTLTADQALQLSLHLLGKAKKHPANATAYVTTCIRDTPHEVQQHIYEHMEVAS